MSENCNHDCASCGTTCGERTAPQSLLAPNNPSSNIKKVIAVMSGKGGVGKSLVTSMMAVTMQRRGYKTAILDADITGPSIPKVFNLKEKVTGTQEGMTPAQTKTGIKIMSTNLILDNETDPVVWRGPIIGGVVKQFWSDVNWGEVDYMFVDMPPGTGDVALTIMQSLPVSGVVMVSTPQPMVSMIVSKAIHMCHQMSIAVYGVIENMAYLECPNCQEKIDFYEKSDLDSFIRENETKIYCTLPMLDLIRDINQYAEYNDNQKEIIESLISDTACSLCDDLHLECHK